MFKNLLLYPKASFLHCVHIRTGWQVVLIMLILTTIIKHKKFCQREMCRHCPKATAQVTYCTMCTAPFSPTNQHTIVQCSYCNHGNALVIHLGVIMDTELPSGLHTSSFRNYHLNWYLSHAHATHSPCCICCLNSQLTTKEWKKSGKAAQQI